MSTWRPVVYDIVPRKYGRPTGKKKIINVLGIHASYIYNFIRRRLSCPFTTSPTSDRRPPAKQSEKLRATVFRETRGPPHDDVFYYINVFFWFFILLLLLFRDNRKTYIIFFGQFPASGRSLPFPTVSPSFRCVYRVSRCHVS